MEIDKRTGAELHDLRVEKKMSQSEVARQLNVSRSVVARIEKGAVAISVSMFINYCMVLDVLPDNVFSQIAKMF